MIILSLPENPACLIRRIRLLIYEKNSLYVSSEFASLIHIFSLFFFALTANKSKIFHGEGPFLLKFKATPFYV